MDRDHTQTADTSAVVAEEQQAGGSGFGSESPRDNSRLHFDRPEGVVRNVETRRSRGMGGAQPLPELPRGVDGEVDEKMPRSPPRLDWIVPHVSGERLARERTAGERLQPTLLTAITERDKYALKAKMTGWALNAAIGLQVLLGALTTGLSAVTTGRQTSIMTAILGGLATIVASYLARARGSNEPELSITRVKDLEQFIRECEAFQMDEGHKVGDECDHNLETLRRRFEELLGNANGERKLSPPV